MGTLKSIDISKSENLFEFENVELLSCRIAGYRTGHSQLWIVVTDGQKVTNIVFLMPQYFEGAFRWRGANFKLGSQVECSDILQKHHIDNGDAFSLFLVETAEHSVIKIIADSAYFSDTIPGGF